MWCVDDCYITSKIPFTSNREVQLRVLPYVSWCLIQCCVILPIFASGVFACDSEDFTRTCTFDLWRNYAIFIANQLFLGRKMIGTFARREMLLFSRNFEKKINNKFCVSGDCKNRLSRNESYWPTFWPEECSLTLLVEQKEKQSGSRMRCVSHMSHKAGLQCLHVSNITQHTERCLRKGKLLWVEHVKFHLSVLCF